MSSRVRLSIALVLAAAVAALEFWGGAAAHSLALTSDAVHVCMDVFALAIALGAAIGATRRANRRKTFGYGRLEVLGALANGTLLLCATLVIVYEAIRRFAEPVQPHGGLMTSVAAIALVVNVTMGLTLSHGHDHDNLNIRAALFHVLSDALGALAVIIGGIAIILTGQAWIDPLLSLFVAAIIVVGVVRVLRDASDVLLEGAPRGVDSADVERSINAIVGVVGVHDLHVWTIASGSHALSAHVMLDDRRISEAANVLRQLRCDVRDAYGITHVTVQLECEQCDPGEVMICGAED
jgi:cobalt-zinc-cadmium efflux system protein